MVFSQEVAIPGNEKWQGSYQRASEHTLEESKKCFEEERVSKISFSIVQKL